MSRQSAASPSADPQRRSPRELELEDRLSDLMTGFEFWRDHKVASAELSTIDELFVRWVEHGEAQ